MAKPTKVSDSIKVPVQRDRNVFVQGFIDTGDIRIRFVPDGFLHEGAFRFFLNNGENGEVFPRGPVTVTTHAEGDRISMDVSIELQDGVRVKKHLTAAVCDEIEQRVDAVRALLHTYDLEEEHASAA